MKKVKQGIIILLILLGLFFLFGPEVVPENMQPQEMLEAAKSSDVVIIFNPGGWGNTPIEQAEDFRPIIEGVQSTLNEWGYNTVVVPYIRTKNDFLGKMSGARDFFNSFEASSEDLAEKIDFLAEKLPDKKIIVAGLSAGGAFASKTYEKISEETRDSIITITAGTPFWVKPAEGGNILRLTNAGKDSLVVGEIKILFSSLLKSSFKWFSAKISGESISLSQISNQFIGHTYEWETTAPEITLFLENKIK